MAFEIENSSHELTKAYLFLRTAHSAVTNLSIQVKSTTAYVKWNSVNGYYTEHVAYQEKLDTEERDLEIWQERLLEGQVGFLDWAAIRAMKGKRLPPELLGLIRDFLREPFNTS